MRFVILKDSKITQKEMLELQNEFSTFVKKHTGITPVFFVEEHSYLDVPVEADGDGDLKPTTQYMNTATKKVHDRYGTWGTDSVVMLVHRDNWIFDGIWGTNFSNVYYQYHVHLCRFDHKNVANSLGTLYHEWMHSLDALIKTHLGIEIDTLFKGEKCFTDWDTTCVHGNRTVLCKDTKYSYIKWKDNTDALEKIAPLLQQAYRKRQEMILKSLLIQIIHRLRALLNKKNGVSPSIKNS